MESGSRLPKMPAAISVSMTKNEIALVNRRRSVGTRNSGRRQAASGGWGGYFFFVPFFFARGFFALAALAFVFLPLAAAFGSSFLPKMAS